MFDVCYSGETVSFDTVDQAEGFCWQLMIQKIGSDIWVGEELHTSYIYDMRAGTFSIERNI